MRSFDATKRGGNLWESRLLEASAGTGKTFSIENIVLRLLIEEKALGIDEILVVTFTRAATLELRDRIRENISKVVGVLKRRSLFHFPFEQKTFEKSHPDYLCDLLEKGEESIKLARERLEEALYRFEEAQIFTIHSFCYKILREKAFEYDVTVDSWEEEGEISTMRIFSIVRDFLRTGVKRGLYSPEQLRIVLKEHRNKVENLERSLAKVSLKFAKIETFQNYQQASESFSKKVLELRNTRKWSSGDIIEDFKTLAPFYNKLCNRKGEVKEEYLKQAKFFARLFDEEEICDLDAVISHGFSFLEKMHSDNLKKNKDFPQEERLRHPSFFCAVQRELLPLVERESSFLEIFARMAADCSSLMKKRFVEQGVFSHDDILKEMGKLVEDEDVCRFIRGNYGAAVVDEFQDTDPFQWKIFYRLFVSKDAFEIPIYLVGDPKQSIYGFRRADIYTYLQAAYCLGKERWATLDTNYRSQAPLVRALNALFSPESVSDFMRLPRTGEEIAYQEVKPSGRVEEKSFSDGLGVVHFFVAEGKLNYKGGRWPDERMMEDFYFPYIAEEILRLYREDDIDFRQCAVLVRDRYEAEKLQRFLKKREIESVTQRSASLMESPSFSSLRELLRSVMRPESHSEAAIALGGRIIAWTHLQVREFCEGKRVDFVLERLYRLRESLFDRGFAHFFQDLMRSSWSEGETILEGLLARKGGGKLYQDLQQIAELFISEGRDADLSTESLLSFFEEMKSMDINEDERMKVRQGEDANAVHILTIHVSKGLEFDVVFALGLARRTPLKKGLLPVFQEGEEHLLVRDLDSAPYLDYLRELDSEKMRQLYVAMTRAKYRLYIPVAIDAAKRELPFASASPMELFLAKLGHEKMRDEELYSRIQSFDGEILFRFVKNLPKEVQITAFKLEKFEKIPFQKFQAKERKLKFSPPEVLDIPGDPLFIQSFSSLFTHSGRGNKGTPPKDWEEAEKTRYTLPVGSETGIVLHRILETLLLRETERPFTLECTAPHIHSILLGTPMRLWECVFSEIALDVLKYVLSDGKFFFSLEDILSDKMFVEMEFFFSEIYGKRKAGENCGEGFFKGFIDLVFEYNRKYYFLDWKSNWLGAFYENYGREDMEKSMKEHGYFLQAKIYLQALRNYLKIVDDRPFEECFGGCFYLFLRGMTRGEGDKGVYYISPEECGRLLKKEKWEFL